MSASTRVNIPPRTVLSRASSSEPAGLPVGPTVSLELRYIPAGIPIRAGWRLASSLMVVIRTEENHFVANVPFVDEYGLGATGEAALEDLLTSLVDYLESLLRRESRLSEPLKRDLENLKKVLAK